MIIDILVATIIYGLFSLLAWFFVSIIAGFIHLDICDRGKHMEQLTIVGRAAVKIVRLNRFLVRKLKKIPYCIVYNH